MENKEKLNKLHWQITDLYGKHNSELLFHGWHHINFVTKKALEFAESISSDKFLVETAALVHDLNYIVEPNSEPEIAKDLRHSILADCGYTQTEIDRIEKIVMESHTGTRGTTISEEGKALSDADTLFKALPTTPILFASKYITQNQVDVYKLAHKVTSEQNPLMKKGIYFYTKAAESKYLRWAKANLEMWNCVEESFQDPDVKEMLEIAKQNKII